MVGMNLELFEYIQLINGDKFLFKFSLTFFSMDGFISSIACVGETVIWISKGPLSSLFQPYDLILTSVTSKIQE